MKFLNKATGEICEAEAREDGIYLRANWSDEEKWFKYELDLLASGWEYYVKPKEPLIKDEKIRKAVRAWWAIQENPLRDASVLCTDYSGVAGHKDHDGFHNYCIYGYVDSSQNNRTAVDFEFRTKTYFDYDRNRDYTLEELCGEEEE